METKPVQNYKVDPDPCAIFRLGHAVTSPEGRDGKGMDNGDWESQPSPPLEWNKEMLISVVLLHSSFLSIPDSTST